MVKYCISVASLIHNPLHAVFMLGTTRVMQVKMSLIQIRLEECCSWRPSLCPLSENDSNGCYPPTQYSINARYSCWTADVVLRMTQPLPSICSAPTNSRLHPFLQQTLSLLSVVLLLLSLVLSFFTASLSLQLALHPQFVAEPLYLSHRHAP